LLKYQNFFEHCSLFLRFQQNYFQICIQQNFRFLRKIVLSIETRISINCTHLEIII